MKLEKICSFWKKAQEFLLRQQALPITGSMAAYYLMPNA
jgi:hypothetical protein